MFLFPDVLSKERIVCASCSWHGLKSKYISLCSCKLVHARLKCANMSVFWGWWIRYSQFKHSGIYLYRFHKAARFPWGRLELCIYLVALHHWFASMFFGVPKQDPNLCNSGDLLGGWVSIEWKDAACCFDFQSITRLELLVAIHEA